MNIETLALKLDALPILGRRDAIVKLLEQFELEAWKRGMRDAVCVAQCEVNTRKCVHDIQSNIETAIDRKCVQTWRLD